MNTFLKNSWIQKLIILVVIVLLFNFIFSNINILYLIIISILTLTKTVQDTMLQIFVLTMFATIKFAVRGFLEIEAMTKSKYLAKEYIESKNILTKEEEKNLLEKYDEINKLGVPFMSVRILTGSLCGILVYAIIACLVNFM